jgi:hypothetical protein
MKSPIMTAITALAASGAVGLAVVDRIERKQTNASMDRLRRELASLEAAPSAAESNDAPSAAPSSAGNVRDRLERAFQADRPDASWTARDRSAALAKIGAKMPAGSVVRSFECRESMCRMEARYDSLESAARFARNALMNPADRIWNAAAYHAPLADERAPGDPVVYVTYVAREGKAL